MACTSPGWGWVLALPGNACTPPVHDIVVHLVIGFIVFNQNCFPFSKLNLGHDCHIPFLYIFFEWWLAELAKAEANLDAMKSQAESTNRAHDDLLGEHRKLQVTNALPVINLLRFSMDFSWLYSFCRKSWTSWKAVMVLERMIKNVIIFVSENCLWIWIVDSVLGNSVWD